MAWFLPWFRHPIGEFCWFPPLPRLALKPTEDQPMTEEIERLQAEIDQLKAAIAKPSAPK